MTENEAIRILGDIKLLSPVGQAAFRAIKCIKELQKYREIGTVEECREAVEKQKPKKMLPLRNGLLYDGGWRCKCPNCGCAAGENFYHPDVTKDFEYCSMLCRLYKGCLGCPLSSKNNKSGDLCGDFKRKHPEEFVSIVEKWSAEHPVKTRQSEFLKMFPDAALSPDGYLAICPRDIDKKVRDVEYCGSEIKCYSCKKDYWLAEVE